MSSEATDLLQLQSQIIKMKLYISFVLFLLICSSCLDADPFFTVFNSLMQNNGLKSSSELVTCLKDSSKQSRQKFLQYVLKSGAQASSGLLPKVIGLIQHSFVNKFNQETVQCIQNTNDLKLLLRHYNTSLDNLSLQFEKYSRLNFIGIHYYFTNMSVLYARTDIIQSQKYAKIGLLIHQMNCVIYNNGKNLITDDPWTLPAENVETLNEYFGVSVSNGIIGAVSAQSPFSLSSTVLAGAYDKLGRGRVDNLVQTFSALNVEIQFNSQNLKHYNYYQQLNMKEGSMLHSFSSQSCSVSYKYHALKNFPNIFLTQFEISIHQDGELIVKNVHDSPKQLVKISKGFEQIDASKQVYSILQTSAQTPSGKLQLTIASSYIGLDAKTVRLLHEDWNLGTHLLKAKIPATKGNVIRFGIITCLMSSQHHPDPLNQAIRLIVRAASIVDLTKQHKIKWDELWKSDIIIQGNDADQKNVRNMLYHCYSFISHGRSYGVSPMGLSGLGYNGHVFWDMDIWIYPAILVLKPSLAKYLIQYRIQRLSAAIDNAFINGYLGAMYPWESSKLGIQATPVWALSGPLQHHISGCVAFSVWNYYLVSQDKDWLRSKGYNVLYSVAQFFQSRVSVDEQGNYHIKNVVAADQWAENVDDDAFTNAVAKVSLQVANKAAKILNYTTNPKWDEIAKKIVILKMQDNTTRQHSTYNGENIKQADVNLLSFPLKMYTNSTDILRDLKYYQSRIPNAGTPAMTYSIFTILYSRLEDQNNSYKYFKQSFTQYLRKPFSVFAQTKGGSNPYFLTGAGGVLQSMVYGFGGLDITQKGVELVKSVIPKQWKKVTIKRQSNSFLKEFQSIQIQ